MRDDAFFGAVRRRTAAVTVRQFGRRAHRLTSLRNRPAHGARTHPPIVAGWYAILELGVGGELPCVYTPKTTAFFSFSFLLVSSPLLLSFSWAGTHQRGPQCTTCCGNARGLQRREQPIFRRTSRPSRSRHRLFWAGRTEKRLSCPCGLSQVP